MSHPFRDPPQLHGEETIGGKAEGLLRLERAGLRVPPWRVMNAATASEGGWRQYGDALAEMFEALSTSPFHGVAVRSSAANEDGRGASFAGVYETVLVDDAEDMASAMETVLASASTTRASVYAKDAAAMAVIVQARVVPSMSGIAFSADPSAADAAQWYCEVVKGQGDQLADGEASPSRFWIDFEHDTIAQTEIGKDGPKQLEGAIRSALGDALRAMEDALDSAVDIEWALDATGVWFLQARPVTRVQFPPPDFCATSWFFDQRFSEPIHPFTRTTLLPVIRKVAIDDALAMRRVANKANFCFYGGQAYLPHATYRAMLRGAPYWWLSPDLRQLRPERCSCPPEKDSIFDTLRYALDALRAVIHSAGDVFLNIRRWDQFRSQVEVELDSIVEDTGSHWRVQWAALDEFNRRFIAIHRWSILWADYGYRLVRRLPAPLRQRVEAGLQGATRLVTADANRALAALSGDPDPQALDNFARRYGHRSGSLDYATPTWGELAAENKLPPAQPVPPRNGHGRWRTALYPLVRLLELREEQRFTWERILAKQRELAFARAEELVHANVINAATDIWFLHRDEAWADSSDDLRDRVAARRHMHRLEQVAARPLYIGPAKMYAKGSAGLLQGLGASGGCAGGAVRNLARPEDFDPARDTDCILVLRALDPAWTPVLGQVRGLVIERGGILSHASVLAREYGVPLVIGVEDATTLLADGIDIQIDGDAGSVQITGSTPRG